MRLGYAIAAAVWVRAVLPDPAGRRMVASSVLYWVGTVACLWASLRSVGVSLPLPELVLAFALGHTAMILPLPLGGVGGVDAAMTYALTVVGVPLALALVAVAVYRLFAFWMPTIPALAALVAAPAHGRSAREDSCRSVPKMMDMRLLLVCIAALVLVASAGAANAPVNPVRATMSTTSTMPVADTPWRYTIVVKDRGGKPLRAKARLQLLLGTRVVGCWKRNRDDEVLGCDLRHRGSSSREGAPASSPGPRSPPAAGARSSRRWSRAGGRSSSVRR